MNRSCQSLSRGGRDAKSGRAFPFGFRRVRHVSLRSVLSLLVEKGLHLCWVISSGPVWADVAVSSVWVAAIDAFFDVTVAVAAAALCLA